MAKAVDVVTVGVVDTLNSGEYHYICRYKTWMVVSSQFDEMVTYAQNSAFIDA